MDLIKYCLSLSLILTTCNETFSQQRRTSRTSRKPSVTTTAQTSNVTFDTLIARDAYKIYAEVRNIGQVLRSNSVNELLDPILRLASPSEEFKALIKQLNLHAEDVTSSRLMIATWATTQNVPELIAVLEFGTPEEAAKFKPKLNSFLPKIWPTPTQANPKEESKGFEADLQTIKTQGYSFLYVFSRKDGRGLTDEDASFLKTNAPQLSAWIKSADNQGVVAGTNVELSQASLDMLRARFAVENRSNDVKTPKSAPADASSPGYYLEQINSLLVITPRPLNLKTLRPAGSKLLTEDPSFRIARGRFVSEQIFIFVDVNEDAGGKTRNQQITSDELETTEKISPIPVPAETSGDKFVLTEIPVTAPSPEASPEPTPDPIEAALSETADAFFRGQAKWPDAFGVGISFDNDSLDVKALMVDRPGEKSDLIPIFPNLIPGAALTPDAPSILPANTELFAMLSLDFQQIYSAMTRPVLTGRPALLSSKPPSAPFVEIEERLKLSIKDDVLPLLGSEIVISVPVETLAGEFLPGTRPLPAATPDDNGNNPVDNGPSFVVAVSLRDKEGMKLLLPRIVDAIGFKGASALAQKEMREDTEIVTYANVFSYAFVANFLVISPDPREIRHVVDSYLKHDTLSSDSQFKNYTRWQPQQQQAQIYVSPALMKNYKALLDQQSAAMNDQLREFVARLTLVAQPITYSLSSDGLGTLHELHVPKNLVLLAVAGISAASNPSPLVASERSAIGSMYTIASAENQYRAGKGAGSFGTLEQLQAEGLIAQDTAEPSGYKVNLTLLGATFELTATPREHGKTGRISYFINETNILRGADHVGGMATSSDPPIY